MRKKKYLLTDKRKYRKRSSTQTFQQTDRTVLLFAYWFCLRRINNCGPNSIASPIGSTATTQTQKKRTIQENRCGTMFNISFTLIEFRTERACDAFYCKYIIKIKAIFLDEQFS